MHLMQSGRQEEEEEEEEDESMCDASGLLF